MLVTYVTECEVREYARKKAFRSVTSRIALIKKTKDYKVSWAPGPGGRDSLRRRAAPGLLISQSTPEG